MPSISYGSDERRRPIDEQGVDRFDPAADWTDPINTSPYLIRLVPMYVDDVLERMELEDPKTGAPKWKKYSEAEIREATLHQWKVCERRQKPDL